MSADYGLIIATVRQICTALSKNTASVQEITSIIGVPDPDKSVLNQFFISPREPSIAEAYIVAESTNSQIPSNVTLDLKQPSPLSLKIMEKTWGVSKIAPPNPNGTSLRAWVADNPADSEYSCAIFAALTKNGNSIVKITIRRDQNT